MKNFGYFHISMINSLLKALLSYLKYQKISLNSESSILIKSICGKYYSWMFDFNLIESQIISMIGIKTCNNAVNHEKFLIESVTLF